MKTINHGITILTLATLATSGCALTSTSASPSRAASYHWPQLLDDSQIVQYVLSVNKAEMQAANAAQSRLSGPVVWQLAQRMNVDHAAIDEKFRGLNLRMAERHGGAPVDPEGLRDITRLRVLNGAKLDKAYVDDEVKFHEAVIAAIEQKLMPSAKSEELKASLQDLRADAAAHLQQAQNVQLMISPTSSPLDSGP